MRRTDLKFIATPPRNLGEQLDAQIQRSLVPGTSRSSRGRSVKGPGDSRILGMHLSAGPDWTRLGVIDTVLHASFVSHRFEIRLDIFPRFNDNRRAPQPNRFSETEVAAMRLAHVALLFALGGAGSLGYQGHTRDILSIAFSPDGKWVATASDDDTVKLWSWPEMKLAATLTGHNTATGVCFSPDGRRLATSGNDETVRLWDVATGKSLRTIQTYTRGALAFSPTGDLLAIGDGRDTVVSVVDGMTLAPKYQFLPSGDRLEGGYIAALVFSPDGRGILTAGYRERVVHLFDAATGKTEIWKSPAGAGRFVVTGAAFSADGTVLAVGGGEGSGGDGEIALWRMPSGESLGTLSVGEKNAWIRSVDLSRDGTLVGAAIADKTVRVWSIADKSLALTLTGADNELRSVRFAIDGKGIVGGNGSALAIWEISQRLAR